MALFLAPVAAEAAHGLGDGVQLVEARGDLLEPLLPALGVEEAHREPFVLGDVALVDGAGDRDLLSLVEDARAAEVAVDGARRALAVGDRLDRDVRPADHVAAGEDARLP